MSTRRCRLTIVLLCLAAWLLSPQRLQAGLSVVGGGSPATLACGGTDKFRAYDASTGLFTCAADSGGGGSDATAIHDDVAGEYVAVTAKATPVVTDHLLIEDSAAGNAKKDITIGSLETALEGILDLNQLQGTVMDVQVPDTITVNLSATATALTDGDKGDFSCVTSVCTMDANSVALSTDTTGDYVAGVTANQGLLKTGTEAATLGLIACTTGQILKNSGGTSWICATDDTGGGGADATAIHDDQAGEIVAITDKVTPVAADHLLIEDSAAANAKKDITIGSLETAIELMTDLPDLQGQISDTQIADGAVDGGTGGEITDASITAADLGTDSVSADELNATGVESELEVVLDLADLQGQITDLQIADGAVDGGTGGEITDGSLTAADLGTDSVSADELNATGVESELEAVLDLPQLQGLLGGSQLGALAKAATAFPLADATPDVSATETWIWRTSDDVIFTDFDDGDDHSEFTTERAIFIVFAHESSGLACSNTAVFVCNGGVDWPAEVGSLGLCVWSPTTLRWSCLLVGASGTASPSTLDAVVEAGRTTDNLTSFTNRLALGDTSNAWSVWCDGAGACAIALCPVGATLESQCVTSHLRARDVDLQFRNASNLGCWEINKTTGFLEVLNPGGTCPNTFGVTGVVDFGATTSFEVPNAAAPTTDAVGELATDTNAWAASRGALQHFDGTANTYVVAALASDTPTNGQVPTWNTGGTITWETGSGGTETGVLQHLFGCTDNDTTDDEDYLRATNESAAACLNTESGEINAAIAKTGTFKYLGCQVTTAPGAGTSATFTVRNNTGAGHAATDLTCTIANTATGCTATNGTTAVTAGQDRFDVEFAFTGAAADLGALRCAVGVLVNLP